MVHTDLTHLGSWHPPQGPQSLHLHPHLKEVLYADWTHLDRILVLPKRLARLNHMEEKLTKKWNMPLVDAATSYPNKILMCPVDDTLFFKNLAVKWLETFLMTSFALARSAGQPAVVAIGICQSLKGE